MSETAPLGPPPWLIADRIKAERKRIGLTQEAAAKLLGTTRGNYKQLEESCNPTAATLHDLVEKVGMRPSAILVELFAYNSAGMYAANGAGGPPPPRDFPCE